MALSKMQASMFAKGKPYKPHKGEASSKKKGGKK
jgi:hypothetical protein